MILNPNKAMFSLKKPSYQEAEAFVLSQQNKSFTYPEVGETRLGPYAEHHPLFNRYRRVHRRFLMGEGIETYERLKRAFLDWQMFALGWVELHRSNIPIEEKALVGIISQVMGVWSINVCRLIYTIDETTPLIRFGLGYGTLPGHAIRGEERILIEFNPESGDVFYEIYSFSAESQLIARITAFRLRSLQDRFARESSDRMHRFAQNLLR
ncbi:MAG: DUF1990 domain-containing protein [Magnetococcales bacterium]|nr:DUF1990 domain-containing protein [Magnetococcales bacterium]